MLTDLNNRAEDVLIALVDGLAGFPEAIRRVIYSINSIAAVHWQFQN